MDDRKSNRSGEADASARVGIVVIGRNEGDRLKTCLRSIPSGVSVVYVDSGSTDDSVAFARALSAHVVELPTAIGFTAARARNAGFEVLKKNDPEAAYVQMIDGDCALQPHWLDAAIAGLEADPGLAAIFGRRRERFPQASIYNAICNAEWDVPVGPALSCGGDVLFRISAFDEAGGYNPDLIAGEEPDLCLRMREKGWRIERIPAEMTLHDANILHFGPWWRRARRSGHAFVEHVWRHGARSDPSWIRQVRSIIVWGGVLPTIAISGVLLALVFEPIFWAVPLAYLAILAAQICRIALRGRVAGEPKSYAWRNAALLMIAKFAQIGGGMTFLRSRLLNRRSLIIEYKG
ncbi:glycosyltransferase family 2 protein [Sphingobium boeckii]|uniref:GT2 family glycosyltransferase n=1 Tax=Sphingobium boeckii TaxID=1082345 RepID=A0A7W9AJ39_9SPHN|nr:glycosyltransferase [Sphingobium boeckii]MBB5686632.1 GT2 family glycosyltransferase [Sphingobium boeckii]